MSFQEDCPTDRIAQSRWGSFGGSKGRGREVTGGRLRCRIAVFDGGDNQRHTDAQAAPAGANLAIAAPTESIAEAFGEYAEAATVESAVERSVPLEPLALFRIFATVSAQLAPARPPSSPLRQQDFASSDVCGQPRRGTPRGHLVPECHDSASSPLIKAVLSSSPPRSPGCVARTGPDSSL